MGSSENNATKQPARNKDVSGKMGCFSNDIDDNQSDHNSKHYKKSPTPKLLNMKSGNKDKTLGKPSKDQDAPNNPRSASDCISDENSAFSGMESGVAEKLVAGPKVVTNPSQNESVTNSSRLSIADIYNDESTSPNINSSEAYTTIYDEAENFILQVLLR